MTTDQIITALNAVKGASLRFQLATGQQIVVAHADSVFIRGRDVLVLHRAEPDSNRLHGYDVLDAASVLTIDIAGNEPALLPAADPSPLVTPEVAVLAWLESLLAVMACVVICALVGNLGYDYYLRLPSRLSIATVWLIGGWSLLIAVELCVLVSILRFYRHRIYPLPLHYALGFRLPGTRWLRGCMGLFWLGHAALGVWSFSQLGHFVSNAARLWDGPVKWLIHALDAMFVFAGAHASTLFLLLAAKSFGTSQDGLRRLWRFRILIDLLIVVISLGILHQQTIDDQPRPSRRRSRRS